MKILKQIFILLIVIILMSTIININNYKLLSDGRKVYYLGRVEVKAGETVESNFVVEQEEILVPIISNRNKFLTFIFKFI